MKRTMCTCPSCSNTLPKPWLGKGRLAECSVQLNTSKDLNSQFYLFVLHVLWAKYTLNSVIVQQFVFCFCMSCMRSKYTLLSSFYQGFFCQVCLLLDSNLIHRLLQIKSESGPWTRLLHIKEFVKKSYGVQLWAPYCNMVHKYNQYARTPPPPFTLVYWRTCTKLNSLDKLFLLIACLSFRD